LVAILVEMLVEVAFAIEQRDGRERHARVRGRTQRIAGEDAEASGIRRDVGRQRNFHRKVGRTDWLSGFGHRVC